MHIPDSGEEGNARPRSIGLDAAAGALAGAIARFAVGPLDVVKIRFQVQLEPIAGAAASKYTGFSQALWTIFREEGLPGLWRGTVPGLLLTIPYTAVQFVTAQQVKQLASGWGLPPGYSWLLSLGSGAVAGAAGTLASYPFDLLRTTLAAQGEPKVYNSMAAAARAITRERGLAGLYSGVGITLVEIMPYAALQFGLFDALNGLWNTARVDAARKLKTRGGAAGGSGASSAGAAGGEGRGAGVVASVLDSQQVQHFTCGLLAGLCAKLATHPLDVAKKRYQVAGLQRSLRYGARVEAGLAHKTLPQCLAHIFRHEGAAGLWKGSIPSIVKAAPSAAITFTAYEAILRWMAASQQREQAAAVAGAGMAAAAAAAVAGGKGKGRS